MDMHSRLSNIYGDMKKRCYKPYCKAYKDYGARGITLCDEWLDEEKSFGNASKGWLAFKDWAIKNGYSDNLTIDRIDVNKGYSPENCRWITKREQCNNKRKTRYYTYKGKTQTLVDWCSDLKLNYNKTFLRLYKGWTVEKAFETK